MDINEIASRFFEVPSMIAVGPSCLESLGTDEFWLEHVDKIAMPSNLLRLAQKIDSENKHLAFLIRMIRYFRGFGRPRAYYQEDAKTAMRIVQMVLRLKEQDKLTIIEDDVVDAGIEKSFEGLYPGKAFEISLSPERNFLREYLVKVYSWSLRTGGVVIERYRRVFSDLGHHIAALQLPDKLDHVLELKSQYINRIFKYPGGRTTKFFVSLAVAVGGLHYSLLGAVGVLIVFIDP